MGNKIAKKENMQSVRNRISQIGNSRGFSEKMSIEELDNISSKIKVMEPESNKDAVLTHYIHNGDLLCAGFSCQAFYIAGRRRCFEDTRRTLFFYISEIIKSVA